MKNKKKLALIPLLIIVFLLGKGCGQTSTVKNSSIPKSTNTISKETEDIHVQSENNGDSSEDTTSDNTLDSTNSDSTSNTANSGDTSDHTDNNNNAESTNNNDTSEDSNYNDTFNEVTNTTPESSNPVDDILDTMWVAYEYTFNNGYPMYLISFRSDGTMHYSAGWVKSEIAFSGEGTWTSSGNQITYAVSGDGMSFYGTLEFTLVAGDNLVLSHVSGDALNYLMANAPMEFVVQGSSMDNPPI